MSGRTPAESAERRAMLIRINTSPLFASMINPALSRVRLLLRPVPGSSLTSCRDPDRRGLWTWRSASGKSQWRRLTRHGPHAALASLRS